MLNHIIETDQTFSEIKHNTDYLETIIKDKLVDEETTRKILEEASKSSILEVALDYVDNRDNIDIIDKYNLSHIIDYEVIRVGENKVNISLVESIQKNDSILSMEYIINTIDIGDELRNDFMSVYINMYDNIKDFGLKKQFDLTLNATTVAYKSATNVIKRLNDYSKMLGENSHVFKDSLRQGNLDKREYIKKHLKQNTPNKDAITD